MESVCGNAAGAPRLSVVMPVRNLAPFVGAAIESILAQSFADFEFVIGDDGSSDGTREIVRAWAERDPRIRLLEREGGLGPAGSSNWVVSEARGEIVARMDGDDVSHPDRLRRQLAILDANPEACLVGSLWEVIDERGRRVRPRDRMRLLEDSLFAPFPHGSIMYRRPLFMAAGGYRAAANYWEDLDLYARLAAFGTLLVLPEALYQHRATVLSTRIASPRATVEASVDRMYRRALGRGPVGADGRLLPDVFLSMGSTRLWSGRRPGVLRRMLRRGELRFDVRTASILAWACWGAVSPLSLRAALRQIAMLRDRSAAARMADGEARRWECRIGIAPTAAPDGVNGGSRVPALTPS